MNKKGGVKNMTKETERFTLRLTKELKEQLNESKKRMGLSVNALVIQILSEWLENHSKKEK